MTKLLTSLRLIRGIELGINIQISPSNCLEFFSYLKDRAFLVVVKRTQMESCHSTVLHPAIFIQWFIMGILSYHTYLKTYNGSVMLISCGYLITQLATSFNMNIQTIFLLSWLYIILQFICFCNIAQTIFLLIYPHKYNHLIKAYESLSLWVYIAKFLCREVIPMQYSF